MTNGKTTENFDTVAKLLTGAVAIVITATGTIGAVSGGFASLLRNAALPVILALGLAAFTVLLAGFATVLPGGKLNGRWWLRVIVFLLSALLLFASLGILLFAQVNLQGTSARPVVMTDWTTIGTSSVGLKVSAEADSLSKNDVLTINVMGSNPNNALQPFYKGSSGPDEDGKAKQQVTVTISAPAQFNMNAVFVVAAVLDRESAQPDTQVDCYGDVLKIDPNGRLYKTGQHVGATACLILSTMPTPQPSATPK